MPVAGIFGLRILAGRNVFGFKKLIAALLRGLAFIHHEDFFRMPRSQNLDLDLHLEMAASSA
jgi:hypothetical protein